MPGYCYVYMYPFSFSSGLPVLIIDERFIQPRQTSQDSIDRVIRSCIHIEMFKGHISKMKKYPIQANCCVLVMSSQPWSASEFKMVDGNFYFYFPYLYLQSIERAHDKLTRGHIFLNTGELLDASINRSPTAYSNNPRDERDRFVHLFLPVIFAHRTIRGNNMVAPCVLQRVLQNKYQLLRFM